MSDQPDHPARVEAFVSDLVRKLGWDLQFEIIPGNEGTTKVVFAGVDRDLVLQDRAEVLESLQYLLNRTCARPDEGNRVVVDCDGYRDRKEAELQEIALRVADRVRTSGRGEELGLMNPYERRIVHLALADEAGVATESRGDGLMRRIMVLPS